MNTITNDKLLSLSAHANTHQESNKSNTSVAGEETNVALGQHPGREDSLDLSAAGHLLHQSATTQTGISRPLPQSEEQANALLDRIRQQFEHSGSEALGAHSAIRGSQVDQLLRSTTV